MPLPEYFPTESYDLEYDDLEIDGQGHGRGKIYFPKGSTGYSVGTALKVIVSSFNMELTYISIYDKVLEVKSSGVKSHYTFYKVEI